MSYFPEPYAYSKNEQKQPSRGVLRKRCSENIQQIYKKSHVGMGVLL